ncbi:MAG: glycine zipper family protein [Balneolaceae bacterium]|nr:MAG: glycine zipper family protein [Balneolaceae bacterium]
MKKIINNTMALAATLVLSVFLITFCTQTVEDPKGEDALDKLDDALQEFKTVGLLHNEIMDEVLDDFRNHDGQFEDKEGYFDFLEESLVRNLSSKDLLQGMKVEDIRSHVSQELAQLRSFYGNKPRKALDTDTDNYFQFTVSLYDGLLNPQQMQILYQIEYIIHNASSTQEIISSLEMINYSTQVQSLSHDDRLVIYAATSVGIESAIYWEANFQYWVDALAHGDSGTEFFKTLDGAGFFDSVQWFSGRRMVRADVAGAVGGAVTGCMAGALVGGAGCLPGALAGGLIGAAGASAHDAASQILEHHF